MLHKKSLQRAPKHSSSNDQAAQNKPLIQPQPWWALRFDGCGTGFCLGAVASPFLLALCLELVYRFRGDFDAEGVPFFLLMSAPLGAVAGWILYPIFGALVLLLSR